MPTFVECPPATVDRLSAAIVALATFVITAQAVENKRALTLAPCWSILSLRRAGSDGKEQVP
jgi:hypothetical protein